MGKNQAPWLRTMYDHVWQRDSRFKITNPKGEYETTLGSLAECKEYFENKGWPWSKDRSKRQSLNNTVEKLSLYLNWRQSFQWNPADKEIHLEMRDMYPEMLVAASRERLCRLFNSQEQSFIGKTGAYGLAYIIHIWSY